MKRLLSIAVATGCLSVLGSAQVTTISLSGFNQDCIAEGSGVSNGDSATVQSVTSTTLDSIYVFFESGFEADLGSMGLPVGGAFTSALDGTTPFQLAPYKGNNVLLLESAFQAGLTGANKGSLSLTSASAYSSLSFLVDGFNGSHTTGYTLNFADGSTEAGTFNSPDNFNNSGAAISGFGRVSRSDGFYDYSGFGGNPQMYQVNVSVNASDTSKVLKSISFTNEETATNGYANVGIWAVSGQQSQAVPEPAEVLPLALAALGLVAKRRRK